jgi:hypothetical protein
MLDDEIAVGEKFQRGVEKFPSVKEGAVSPSLEVTAVSRLGCVHHMEILVRRSMDLAGCAVATSSREQRVVQEGFRPPLQRQYGKATRKVL